MKIVFIRFLVVCWVFTCLIAALGLFLGLISLNFEIVWVSISLAAFFSILIMAASFTFLGVLHPKKLYMQIKSN